MTEGDIEVGDTCLKQKYFNWKDIKESASALTIKSEKEFLSQK